MIARPSTAPARARPWLAALAALFASGAARAAPGEFTPAEAEIAFRAAAEACLKADEAGCLGGFERLEAAGFRGADLSYNLGTAYLAKGRLGPAILHLERALRLDPSDADARANLDRAGKLRVDRIEGAAEETPGEEPLASRVASRTSLDLFAGLFAAFWCMGGCLLVLRRLAASRALRLTTSVAGAVLVAAAVPCAAIVASHAWVRERAHESVVVAPSASVLEGPVQGSRTVFEVHEGLKVRALERDGAFRRIRLANGLVGWMAADGLAEIGSP